MKERYKVRTLALLKGKNGTLLHLTIHLQSSFVKCFWAYFSQDRSRLLPFLIFADEKRYTVTSSSLIGEERKKVRMIPGLHGFDILPLLLFAFWIWMLVDCLINQKLKGSEKVLWVLLMIFTSMIGAIIYFFVGRSKRGAQIQGYPQNQGFYQPDEPRQYQPYERQQAQYQPYEQGYPLQRPLDQPKLPQSYAEQPQYEQYEKYEQYEHPQASYPEQTQE